MSRFPMQSKSSSSFKPPGRPPKLDMVWIPGGTFLVLSDFVERPESHGL